jgi:probable F420-dependent oxidoreductase
VTQVRGKLGTWSPLALWQAEPDHGRDAAAELEDLGYQTIWLGNGQDIVSVAESLLAATRTVTVATGILNIWQHQDAAGVGRIVRGIEERFPGRFLLGLGAGPRNPAQAAQSSCLAMTAYLDELDHAGVSARQRVLAALGPRMLALAADRSAGALPLLTTPVHTAMARRTLGPGPLLAVEQGFVLDDDVVRARETARLDLEFYLPKAGYRRTLRGLGFSEHDLSGRGSDRLVDALVPHGGPDQVIGRLAEHLRAGASQVAVQPLTLDTQIGSGNRRLPMAEFRALAAAADSHKPECVALAVQLI